MLSSKSYALDTIYMYTDRLITNDNNDCPTLNSIISIDETLDIFLVFEINDEYFLDSTIDIISIVYFVDRIEDILGDELNQYYYMVAYDACALFPEHNNFINDTTGQVSTLIDMLYMHNRISQPEYGTFLYSPYTASPEIGIPMDNIYDGATIYQIGDKKVILFQVSFVSAVIKMDFVFLQGMKFNKVILPLTRAKNLRQYLKNDQDVELIPWKILRNVTVKRK